MFKTVKLITIIVAIIAVIGGGAYLDHLKKENDRLERNQKILVETHKSQTKSLVLDKRELKNLLQEQKGTYEAVVDSLDLKVKQLESITTSTSNTKIKFKTVLRDTTIYKTDTITKRDTVIQYKFFEWEDYPWVKVEGMIYRDTMECDVQAEDTIHIVNYWERDGWFIFKWFHKKVPCSNVSNVNPYIDVQVKQSIRRR